MTTDQIMTAVGTKRGGSTSTAQSRPTTHVTAAAPATTLPVRPDPTRPAPPQPRRRLGGSTGIGNAVAAAAAAVCTAMLLFGRLTALSGLVGFAVVVLALFLGTYAALIVASGESRLVVVDRLVTVLLSVAAAALGVILTFIVSFTVYKGFHALEHANLFTQDLSRAAALAPLTKGGIKHAFIGTVWMTTLALLFTVPLGLTGAVYLNVARGPFVRFVRTIVEAMTALPSIVAGLFIYASWILLLHFEKSALAAALALSVDMLPIIIRAADVVLRLVPGNLIEAAEALGAPTWRTTWNVMLPTARPGLATAVILGMARGIGETAPVLLTAGFSGRTNTNPLHGPMVSLPLEALELVRSGVPNLQARGFGAAAILLVLVVVLFAIARLIGGRPAGQLTRRQARRRARASTRDANRMITRYDSEAASLGKG